MPRYALIKLTFKPFGIKNDQIFTNMVQTLISQIKLSKEMSFLKLITKLLDQLQTLFEWTKLRFLSGLGLTICLGS